ncbi:hypothetical protein H5410_053170 [Solanum commersonii]|uniref:Uncharacterized protein n=1 Tax=Solanum commersonii TaxID=4109 RepID=A0A9J5X471_SOLCO|nr:hypothetical protein H5410_053170 [Solanum commersonii]
MAIFEAKRLVMKNEHKIQESNFYYNAFLRTAVKSVRHNAKSIENIKEITIPMVHTIYHG